MQDWPIEQEEAKRGLNKDDKNGVKIICGSCYLFIWRNSVIFFYVQRYIILFCKTNDTTCKQLNSSNVPAVRLLTVKPVHIHVGVRHAHGRPTSLVQGEHVGGPRAAFDSPSMMGGGLLGL